MGNFLGDLRNNILFTLSKAAEKKIDGREITKNVDKKMDNSSMASVSEKLQRGPATNLLFEMVEGFWDEDLKALVTRGQAWLDDLEDRIKNEVA